MKLRHIAPAGTPIPLSSFAGWAWDCARGTDAHTALSDAVCERFGVTHCLPISSGRAALALIYRVLRERHPDRDEIVVPAYTCYSVAAAAVRAGLKVRVCDIEPDSLSYSPRALRALDFDRVLAVVSANLYGIPDRLPEIEAIVKAAGAYFIDDAAQAMGASIDGRHCGSFGDIGIYSLDKGKNITTLQGGLIVTRSDELAEALGAAVQALPPPPRSQTLSYSAQLLAYSALLQPRLYWLPERLLDLGGTVYTTEYPMTRYSPALAALALRLFHRLDELSEQRRRNAEGLRHRLQDTHSLAWPMPPQGARAVYARLPALVPARLRADMLSALTSAGYGVSGSYPRSIQDVPELAPHLRSTTDSAAVGRAVAQRLLTFPTHPYVGAPDLERMAALVREIVQSSPEASENELEAVRGL